MMDSQDNVLKQDITEEAVAAQPANVDNGTVAEAGNAPATTAVDSEPDTEAAPLKMYASKHEVLERVKELAHSDETPAKDEVDHLKKIGRAHDEQQYHRRKAVCRIRV